MATQGKDGLRDLLRNCTPGPWKWEGRLLLAANGDAVLDDGSAGGEYSEMIDTCGPDAKLIAPAPKLARTNEELRAALRIAAEEFRCIGALQCANRAEAALKRAEE